jgi:y4mF family transcriptional regulator
LAALVFGRREVLGLRQEELADLAGCSPRFVHELEAGKPTLQLDKVLDVLNAIGLHVELADGGASRVLATSELLTEFEIGKEDAQ